ncbi:MAG: ribosome maturation factor RimP [Gammaproteobacteria bacterium]|nr:ribosome maturation factor RimP [Gammaproteobacteria bacterium]
MNTKERQVETLLAPTVGRLGYVIWGVELLSHGRHSKLRLFIDNAQGVSIDDCERVSRQVSDVLDVEDTFAQSYTLEVSSPGMDRILFNAEQFVANIGQTVDVRLNFPLDGQKRIVGVLTGVEKDEAIVQVEDEEYLLPIENVQRARIVPRFD